MARRFKPYCFASRTASVLNTTVISSCFCKDYYPNFTPLKSYQIEKIKQRNRSYFSISRYQNCNFIHHTLQYASKHSAVWVKTPDNLKLIMVRSDANHNTFWCFSLSIFRLKVNKLLITNLLQTIKIQRLFTSTCFLFSNKALPEEGFVKENTNTHPRPSRREGRANLRNLPQPLPRRGARTCKEISYNLLRNYELCIVNYELNTTQHFTFNIKNYASSIVNYELT